MTPDSVEGMVVRVRDSERRLNGAEASLIRQGERMGVLSEGQVRLDERVGGMRDDIRDLDAKVERVGRDLNSKVEGVGRELRELREDIAGRREAEREQADDRRDQEKKERRADRRTYMAATIGAVTAIIIALVGIAQTGILG